MSSNFNYDEYSKRPEAEGQDYIKFTSDMTPEERAASGLEQAHQLAMRKQAEIDAVRQAQVEATRRAQEGGENG